MRCPFARLRDSLLRLLGVRAGLRRRRILLRGRIDSPRRRGHITMAGRNGLILVLLRVRARLMWRSGRCLRTARRCGVRGALIGGRKILVLPRRGAWLILRRSRYRLRRARRRLLAIRLNGRVVAAAQHNRAALSTLLLESSFHLISDLLIAHDRDAGHRLTFSITPRGNTHWPVGALGSLRFFVVEAGCFL